MYFTSEIDLFSNLADASAFEDDIEDWHDAKGEMVSHEDVFNLVSEKTNETHSFVSQGDRGQRIYLDLEEPGGARRLEWECRRQELLNRRPEDLASL